MADLLILMEGGASWPNNTKHAKAAFLPRDPQQLAIADRVLLILPVLYKRLAATRLGDLEHWVGVWNRDQMHAGVPDVGAEEGWRSAALDIEVAQLLGTPIGANGSDIYKSPDQLSWELIYFVARLAGIPIGFLTANQHVRADFVIYKAIAG